MFDKIPKPAMPTSGLNMKAITAAVIGLITLISIFGMVKNQDASELMVIQSIFGNLDVYTEPGPHLQGFGKVTTYPRQRSLNFCSIVQQDAAGQILAEDKCVGATSIAKHLRFNDGGHAFLNGSVNWEMPIDKESIIKIHKAFGSPEAIEQRAVEKMLDAAVYLAGPLMSSTESSGERRSELVNDINDQAEKGVYVTQVKNIVTKDKAEGEKTVTVTEVMRDASGNPKRQQGSVLGEFNIKLQPLSITELKYDNVVESQIKQRQSATTSVQISQANAKKAIQDAITTEKQGEAAAATAKWTQEALKATAVTKAQQDLEVATLNAKKAEQYKREQTLIGEGDAARARAVMQANGALEQKLAALVQMNKDQWENIAKYQGSWVPSVSMGGQAGAHQSGANDLINMLSVKTAKELSLDVSVKK